LTRSKLLGEKEEQNRTWEKQLHYQSDKLIEDKRSLEQNLKDLKRDQELLDHRGKRLMEETHRVWEDKKRAEELGKKYEMELEGINKEKFEISKRQQEIREEKHRIQTRHDIVTADIQRLADAQALFDREKNDFQIQKSKMELEKKRIR